MLKNLIYKSLLLLLTPQSAQTAWASIRSIFGLLPGGDAIIGAQIFGQAELSLVDAISFESLKVAIKNDAKNIDDEVLKLISYINLILISRHKTLNHMFTTNMDLERRSDGDRQIVAKLTRFVTEFLYTIFYCQ